MENFIIYFLVGMLGTDIANEIAKKDSKVNIPKFVLFSLCFTISYLIGFVFFYLVYLFKGFTVPWQGLGVSCLSISLLFLLMIFILSMFKKQA